MKELLQTAAAPMEGVTTRVFRRLHADMFSGTDVYYIPFFTPTVDPGFTNRQMKELDPEVNKGINTVPQLVTSRSADFIWAARDLAALGYKEVNLNLGCPVGPITARGKGAGFLRDLPKLEKFLNEVFAADLPIAVSAKMRVGWADEKEAEAIAEVISKFPFSLVIIHPRLKVDQYRGPVREHVFAQIRPMFSQPLVFNGDIVTTHDIERLDATYPNLKMVMAGRGFVSDPALFRKYKGGPAASKEELQIFAKGLFEGYAQAFSSYKNALMRMKEHWFYMLNLFEPNPVLFKKLFRCKEVGPYEDSVKEIFDECDLLHDARGGWKKPA